MVAVAGQKRFAWNVTAELPGPADSAAVAGHGDATSRAWVRRLSCPGADRDTAVTELHALLLRAARFEIGRRRLAFPQLGGADLDDLAWQSADDALMSVLRRLGDFRGDSRFTTWASKFAIVEAGVKVRKHAWRGREILLPETSWPTVADSAPTPHQLAEARDLLAAVRAEHQAFYRRTFNHRLICEPRPYPLLAKPISLMTTQYSSVADQVHQRYPFFRSTLFERRMLFERYPPMSQVVPANEAGEVHHAA